MKFKVIKYRSIKSTNDKAIEFIKSGKISPSIILAKKQTLGKGRYGKRWTSLEGNIFLTFFFQIKSKKKISTLLKKNVKLFQQILSKYVNKNIKIKYPNDLLIQKKKVCGILQETIFYRKKKFLIVGVGLNTVKSPIISGYPTTFLGKFKKKKLTIL